MALASGKFVAAFLFGLQPSNPVVLASAAAVLALVALGAGIAPALLASVAYGSGSCATRGLMD